MDSHQNPIIQFFEFTFRIGQVGCESIENDIGASRLNFFRYPSTREQVTQDESGVHTRMINAVDLSGKELNIDSVMSDSLTKFGYSDSATSKFLGPRDSAVSSNDTMLSYDFKGTLQKLLDESPNNYMKLARKLYAKKSKQWKQAIFEAFRDRIEDLKWVQVGLNSEEGAPNQQIQNHSTGLQQSSGSGSTGRNFF